MGSDNDGTPIIQDDPEEIVDERRKHGRGKKEETGRIASVNCEQTTSRDSK